MPRQSHPIRIVMNPHRVRVVIGGVIVAETTRALTLLEAALPPIHFIPKDDVKMDLLHFSGRKSECPYKGEAVHYDITAGGEIRSDACWIFPEAKDPAKAISGHVAFFPHKADAIEELNG